MLPSVPSLCGGAPAKISKENWRLLHDVNYFTIHLYLKISKENWRQCSRLHITKTLRDNPGRSQKRIEGLMQLAPAHQCQPTLRKISKENWRQWGVGGMLITHQRRSQKRIEGFCGGGLNHPKNNTIRRSQKRIEGWLPWLLTQRRLLARKISKENWRYHQGTCTLGMHPTLPRRSQKRIEGV